MKVGMIVWSYWPGPEGGAERQCRKIAQQFGKRGIENVVLTSLSSYKLKNESMDGVVKVHRYGIVCPLSEITKKILYRLAGFANNRHEKIIRSLIFWLMLPLEWIARLSFILEVLISLPDNKYDLDILHVHETAWLAGFGAFLSKRWDIPVVCKVRSTPAIEVIGYDTPFRKTWSRLRKEAAFIALHYELREQLLSYGVPEEKIYLIPNGVELPELILKKTILGEVLYVGNFSQGSLYKGFDTLLLGWSEVVKAMPGAHLTLVGGGDISMWEVLAKDLGCLNSVTFAGRVSDPGKYYQQAEIFVLPSRHEGMSNALLEAQSWGLPCVVSDIPANSAIVNHGVNGLTFTVDDFHAMARSILDILSDSNLQAVLGKNARQRVEKTFDIERVVDNLLIAYSNAGSRCD